LARRLLLPGCSAESFELEPEPFCDSNLFQQAGAGADAEVGIGALSQPPAETRFDGSSGSAEPSEAKAKRPP